MLRAALIGCGKIGSEVADDPKASGVQSHAGAYEACTETELVAVCDADAERAERCARRWGLSAGYTDVVRLLAEKKPEIISVCTPDETHASLLKAILRTPNVRGVLAEKPLALNVKDAVEIVSLAKKQNITLSVNYTRRFAANFKALKAWIDKGGLGKVQAVTGIYVKGLVHNGSHWIDLARYLVGEIAEVNGRNHLNEAGPDPTIDVDFSFANGARGHLAGLDKHHFAIFEMDIIGSAGRARITNGGEEIQTYSLGEHPFFTGFTSLNATNFTGPTGMRDAALHAVDNLVHCIKTRSRPLCSGEDGIAAIQIAMAAHAAAKSERKMKVELYT